MSTLTSSSTLAEAIAAYQDNASYEEDGSRSKALAFATACRWILLSMPRRAGQGSASLELDVPVVQRELVSVQEWIALHPSGNNAGGIHRSLEEIRG